MVKGEVKVFTSFVELHCPKKIVIVKANLNPPRPRKRVRFKICTAVFNEEGGQ